MRVVIGLCLILKEIKNNVTKQVFPNLGNADNTTRDYIDFFKWF
jgi:hypothetical protein